MRTERVLGFVKKAAQITGKLIFPREIEEDKDFEETLGETEARFRNYLKVKFCDAYPELESQYDTFTHAVFVLANLRGSTQDIIKLTANNLSRLVDGKMEEQRVLIVDFMEIPGYFSGENIIHGVRMEIRGGNISYRKIPDFWAGQQGGKLSDNLVESEAKEFLIAALQRLGNAKIHPKNTAPLPAFFVGE